MTIDVTGTVTALALVQVNEPATVDLGNIRINTPLSRDISVTNAAPAGGQSLDAIIGANGGSVSASGTIALLAPGATDATSLAVELQSSQAGIVSGTVGLTFSSQYPNGTVTALANQAANLTLKGTVYNEAAYAVANTAPIFHVGDAGIASLIVSDPSSTIYREPLVASVIGASGSITATATTTADIAPNATAGIAYVLPTGHAGTVTGAVTLSFASDGRTIDGSPLTQLGTEVVQIAGTIDNYATAALVALDGGTLTGSGTNYTLDLGVIAPGTTLSAIQIGVENVAASFADLLSGNFIAAGGPITLRGTSFSGVAAGQESDSLSIGLNVGTLGMFAGTIVLDPTGYNASGYAGTLAAQTITVIGSVAPLAEPVVNTPTVVNFGAVRAGTTLSQAISVSNISPAGSEALDVTASASGQATVAGAISQLPAGRVADSGDIVAGLTDLAAGLNTGAVTLNFSSENNLGVYHSTAPHSQSVTLIATVYNEATHAVSTGSLQVFHVGDANAGTILVYNDPYAPYTENLVASVIGSSGAITVAPTTTADIPYYGEGSIGYTIPTNQTGTVTGTVTLSFASDGTGTDGAPLTTIGTQVVTLAAAVLNYATAAVIAVAGPGTLSGGNGFYTLNLGDLAQGQAGLTEDLGITNAAGGTSDGLFGTVVASGDASIDFGGPYRVLGYRRRRGG